MYIEKGLSSISLAPLPTLHRNQTACSSDAEFRPAKGLFILAFSDGTTRNGMQSFGGYRRSLSTNLHYTFRSEVDFHTERFKLLTIRSVGKGKYK
uniref:Uncharacterized protein n=1 Tax=Romanomermis culicivorax TaxID=13658 RepID=A0A915L9T9_ROMCU